MSLIFEWDHEKARVNVQKHQVSFEEAATVFGDPLSVTIDDPLHSKVEERFITIGLSIRSRLLLVVHADRGDQIRIISSRIATANERKAYEDTTEIH
jgi:uncharacterized DUF497 family protein